MKKIKDNIKLICFLEYAAVVISGCIFVLASASWTSPLFPQMYGYDSAWYSLMGRAITKGYVPYRDYFDLKGPVFFFIEAFGQLLIKGRNGIFLIECISSVLSAVFIYKAALLYLKKFQAFIVLGLYYFVYIFLLWGGNTCEEYMLTLSFACIYLALRFIKELWEKNDTPDYSAPAFFFGLSFAAMALSKVTVAAPVIAASLGVLIELIKRGRKDLILKIVLVFFGGFLTVSVPVSLYFIFHGAFKDFIYCAFEFAFKRSTDYYQTFSFEWERNLLICYAGFLMGLLLKFEEKKDAHRKILLILASLLTWLLLHLGTPYTYYFITELPVFVLMLTEASDRMNRIVSRKVSGESDAENAVPDLIAVKKPEFFRVMGYEAMILLVLFVYAAPVKDKLSENLTYLKYPGDIYYEGCLDTWEFIPFYEWDEIYDLESGMIIYEINDSLPTNKYPVNLPYFLHLDPVIKENVLAHLDVKKPKWIISEHMEEFDDDDIKAYVFSHYELARKTSAQEIYRRVE